jgi:modulator of FtsH protease HflK
VPWDSGDEGEGSGRQINAKNAMLRRVSAYRAVIWLMAAGTFAITSFYVFTFQVAPDELGVVLRFGNVARQEGPGLHLRYPYPIEEVRLPKLTRQNILEIGLRTRESDTGGSLRPTYVREESLMLTADENIVDVTFVVYWRIRDVRMYLFSIRDPGNTVRVVAESAMREVVGQSNLEPILTRGRQDTEQAVHRLIQEVLDKYDSGIRIDQVRLQRIDPPAQVIDAFRDVQAAAADKEKLQNDALAYASRMVPEARGVAEQTLESAKGFQHQAIAEADGQTARFLKIRREYEKSPEVTRMRLYLEAMERILAGARKTVIDRQAGAIPYFSLWPQGDVREDKK